MLSVLEYGSTYSPSLVPGTGGIGTPYGVTDRVVSIEVAGRARPV